MVCFHSQIWPRYKFYLFIWDSYNLKIQKFKKLTKELEPVLNIKMTYAFAKRKANPKQIPCWTRLFVHATWFSLSCLAPVHHLHLSLKLNLRIDLKGLDASFQLHFINFENFCYSRTNRWMGGRIDRQSRVKTTFNSKFVKEMYIKHLCVIIWVTYPLNTWYKLLNIWTFLVFVLAECQVQFEIDLVDCVV